MKSSDLHLEVGLGKHGVQTAGAVERFEEVLERGASAGASYDRVRLQTSLSAVLEGTYKQGQCPTLWDGHAAERIARILAG